MSRQQFAKEFKEDAVIYYLEYKDLGITLCAKNLLVLFIDIVPLLEIKAGTSTENIGSQIVLKKSGFDLIGEQKK